MKTAEKKLSKGETNMTSNGIVFDNLALLSDKFVPFQRNELHSKKEERKRKKFTLLVVIQFLELISICKQPF